MFPRWRDIFIFRNSKRLVTGNLAWGERVEMTAQVINRVCRLWFCCLVGQCNGSTTTTYLVGWEYCPAVCTPPFRNWKYFQGLKTTINFQQRYRIPLQVLFVNMCSTDVNSCLEGACCIVVVDNLITSIIQKKVLPQIEGGNGHYNDCKDCIQQIVASAGLPNFQPISCPFLPLRWMLPVGAYFQALEKHWQYCT